MFTCGTALMILWINLVQYIDGQASCGSVIIGDDCGYAGITRLECLRRGCCFDHTARKMNEKCVYPLEYFADASKVTKTFLGTSLLNIPEPTRALDDEVTRTSVENELKKTFRYRYPQVRSVKVTNFTNAEFDYVITIWAEKDFHITSENLMKAYAYVKMTTQPNNICGKYFVGSPIIVDYDECAESDKCGARSTCINIEGSYVCHCIDGFAKNLLGVCTDINECLELTATCKREEECSNTLGSYTCTCKPGFQFDENQKCVDLDECFNDTHRCSRETEQCVNNIGGYTCECKSGFVEYELIGGKVCVEDDPCKSGPCHKNATCENSKSSFKCQCRDGYIGDGKETCFEIDPCLLSSTNNCHDNALCKKITGSFTCTCRPGYRGDGVTCEDVNECNSTGSARCGLNARCENTIGSYKCLCNDGYEKFVTGTCLDIDECANPGFSCHENAICINVPGSFDCSCIDGYLGDGVTSCVKIGRSITVELGGIHCDPVFGPKETETKLSEFCSIDAICEIGFSGVYSCLCPAGLTGNPLESCTDLDECAEEVHSCHAWSKCINSEGGYKCECAVGFVGSGRDCQDVDECGTEVHTCSDDAICINTRSSYICECKYGYTGDGYDCEELSLFVGLVRLAPSYSYMPDLDCPGSKYFTELSDALMEDMFKLFRSTGTYVKDVIVTSFSKGSVLAELIIATVGSSAADLNRVIKYGAENRLSSMISGPPLVVQTLNASLESMNFLGKSKTGILTKKRGGETKVSKTFSGMIQLQSSIVSQYEKLYLGNVINSGSIVRAEFDQKLARELIWMHSYENEFIEEIKIKSIVRMKEYVQNLKTSVEKPAVKFYKASVLMELDIHGGRFGHDFHLLTKYIVPRLTRSYTFVMRREQIRISDGKQKQDIEINTDDHIQVILLDIRKPNAGEIAASYKLSEDSFFVEHLIIVHQPLLMIDGKIEQIDKHFLMKNLQLSLDEDKSTTRPWGLVPISKVDGLNNFLVGLLHAWNITSVDEIDGDKFLGQYDVTIEGNADILNLGERGLLKWFDKGLNEGNVIDENKMSFVGLPKALILKSYKIETPVEKESSNDYNKDDDKESKNEKFEFSASIFLFDEVSPIPLVNVPTSHDVFETTAQVFEPQLFTAFTKGMDDLDEHHDQWEIENIHIKIVSFRQPTPQESKIKKSVVADFEISIEVKGTTTSDAMKLLLEKAFDNAITKNYFAEKLFVGSPWGFNKMHSIFGDEGFVTPAPPRSTSTVTPTVNQRSTTTDVTTGTLSHIHPTTQPGRSTTPTWFTTRKSMTLSTTPQSDSVSDDVTTPQSTDGLAYALYLLMRAPDMSWFQIRTEVELLPPQAKTLLRAILNDPSTLALIPNKSYIYLDAALDQTK